MLMLSAALSACHREVILTGLQSINNQGSDIFVAGSHNTSSEIYTAAYWKNGVLHDLPGSSNARAVSSIYVDGDDVYCVSYDNKSDSMIMWKNDKKYQIEKSSYGVSLVVSQGDVFIAGIHRLGGSVLQSIAKYWRNGIGVNLTDGKSSVKVSSIAVHNNDVYVTGSEGKVAKYWKNGVGVNLTDGMSEAFARSVVVDNNNVYVCGWVRDLSTGNVVARYWENGVANFLEGGAQGTSASTIALSGSDLYVGYHVDDGGPGIPKYMKNGKVYLLPFRGSITSMKVVNDDVYTLGTGSLGNNLSQSLLFKNGVLLFWQDGTQWADASSFFVR